MATLGDLEVDYTNIRLDVPVRDGVGVRI